MLRVAVVFFLLGLVSVLLGAGAIGGMTMEAAQAFLGLFLILSVMSLLASMAFDKKSTSLP